MQPQWHKNQFFRILLRLRFSKDLVELGVQRELLLIATPSMEVSQSGQRPS